MIMRFVSMIVRLETVSRMLMLMPVLARALFVRMRAPMDVRMRAPMDVRMRRADRRLHARARGRVRVDGRRRPCTCTWLWL
jgi:hypothetical protein